MRMAMKTVRSARLIIVWGFAAIIATESIAQAPVLWKGNISKEGDVTVVHNPKEPIYKNEIVTIKEELSIGGENAPSEEVLSLVTDIDTGTDGRIFIVDFQQREIIIVDKFGKFLRKFGKKGQGPGEFLLVTELSYCAAQNELFVHDHLRGSYFDADGNFKRSVPYRFNFTSVKADAQGNLRGIVQVQEGNRVRYELKMLDERGNPGTSLAKTPDIDIGVENPFMPILNWCIQQDGSIADGYPETYEILTHDINGRIVKRILKDFDPIEVTAAEREIWTKSIPPSMKKTKFAFSRYHAAYAALASDERGWIYVGTWEKARDGKTFIIDIFDQAGRYIAKAEWPGVGSVLRFKDGKLYAVSQDENGYPVVKRYALVWRKDIR